jgi:hypothetical protein
MLLAMPRSLVYQRLAFAGVNGVSSVLRMNGEAAMGALQVWVSLLKRAVPLDVYSLGYNLSAYGGVHA